MFELHYLRRNIEYGTPSFSVDITDAGGPVTFKFVFSSTWAIKIHIADSKSDYKKLTGESDTAKEFYSGLLDIIQELKIYPNNMGICYDLRDMRAEVHIGFLYKPKCERLCKKIKALAKDILERENKC